MLKQINITLRGFKLTIRLEQSIKLNHINITRCTLLIEMLIIVQTVMIIL